MKNEKLENNLQNMEGEIDGQRGYIVIILTSLDFRDGPILRRPVAVLLPSFCKTKKKTESKQFDFNQVKWNWIANYYQSQIGCVNRVRTEGV